VIAKEKKVAFECEETSKPSYQLIHWKGTLAYMSLTPNPGSLFDEHGSKIENISKGGFIEA
jgi:hypothetical protein